MALARAPTWCSASYKFLLLVELACALVAIVSRMGSHVDDIRDRDTRHRAERAQRAVGGGGHLALCLCIVARFVEQFSSERGYRAYHGTKPHKSKQMCSVRSQLIAPRRPAGFIHSHARDVWRTRSRAARAGLRDADLSIFHAPAQIPGGPI